MRILTRQYGSLKAAGHSDTTVQMMAYLQCTCMARTRVLYTGSGAEPAFEKEAIRRTRASAQTKGAGGTASTNTAEDNWKICPCCGLVNDHISTACPTQANGASKTPQYTKAAVKAAIGAAPITATAKENLLKMCTALWAKIERSSS